MWSKEKSFAAGAVLALLVCIGPAAMAQTAPAADTTAPAEPVSQQEAVPRAAPAVAVSDEARPRPRTAEEEIVVTGSRIRRKDLTTPAPVTVITREAVQA